MAQVEIDESLKEFMNRSLFEISGVPVTPTSLLLTGVVFVLTLILAKVLETSVKRLLLGRGGNVGSVGVAGRIVNYTVTIIGLAIALNTLGMNLSALFAAGAVFAVGLGFGLQNVVQNFVSGIILLGERVIRVGDVLESEGELMRVEHLGLRSTVARTLDEENVIVPNAQLVQSNVKNLTMKDNLFRLRVPVGVTYDSDLDRVFEVLEQAAATIERDESEKTRDPVILLSGFGSSSIDFEVSVWITDPWRLRQHQSRLALAIWRALRDAQIVIAFPQLDVHFDREAVEAWRVSERSGKAS